MPRDKNGGAEAERLTRETNADLSASAGPPPRPQPQPPSWLPSGFDALSRRPHILGPLASEEAKDAHAAGDEAWAAYINSRPPPTVIIPDPELEERAERLIEAVEKSGLEEALKAVRRKPPGRTIVVLWAQNKSLSEIEVELGVSRGTIIGKVDRARKAGDERFSPRPKVRKLKPVGEEVGNRRRVPPPIVARKPRLLVDLGWSDCRWPTGKSTDGRHLFCGAPQTPGSPYCADCKARLERVSLSSSSSFSPALRGPSPRAPAPRE